MDETTQGRLIEIESNRDAERKLERIHAIERAADLLRSRFDGLLEQLAREAFTDEDVEKLEAKWEKALRDAIAGLRIDFKTANDQQSKDIGNDFRSVIKDEQLQSQQAVIAAIHQRRGRWLGWALGIAGTVIASVATTLIIVSIFGRAT